MSGQINKTNYSESTVSPSVVPSHLGRITKAEFMKIFEVYELWKYESQFSTFFQEPLSNIVKPATANTKKNKKALNIGKDGKKKKRSSRSST